MIWIIQPQSDIMSICYCMYSEWGVDLLLVGIGVVEGFRNPQIDADESLTATYRVCIQQSGCDDNRMITHCNLVLV